MINKKKWSISFSSKYENLLLMGDFNLEHIEELNNNFRELNNVRNLFHLPTSYENPENLSAKNESQQNEG